MISFALCLLVGEYGDDKIGDLSVSRLFQSVSLIVVVCSFFCFISSLLFLEAFLAGYIHCRGDCECAQGKEGGRVVGCQLE